MKRARNRTLCSRALLGLRPPLPRGRWRILSGGADLALWCPSRSPSWRPFGTLRATVAPLRLRTTSRAQVWLPLGHFTRPSRWPSRACVRVRACAVGLYIPATVWLGQLPGRPEYRRGRPGKALQMPGFCLWALVSQGAHWRGSTVLAQRGIGIAGHPGHRAAGSLPRVTSPGMASRGSAMPAVHAVEVPHRCLYCVRGGPLGIVESGRASCGQGTPSS